MNQNFSAKELLRYLRLADLKEHKITKEDLVAKLEIASKAITEGNFDFSIHKNGLIFYTGNLVDILILRKLNDNIKRIYKDEQSNRRVIINQVTTLLPDGCPFWILRTDISKFYESVDRDRIYSKLHNDARLSYFSLWAIKRIFTNSVIAAYNGLPRGIGISATLSEIYMRKFDRYIRGCRGVYYYSRFVDDILIFSNSEDSLKEIRDHMDKNLETGLTQNISKTQIYNGSSITEKNPLEYLGYKFLIQRLKGDTKSVNISIAETKVKKIKTRLVLSFVTFLNDSDIAMLEKRLRFLTGNYSIKSSSESGHDLKAGIYYNYLHINDLSPLKELNGFYHQLLNSKAGSFGTKLTAKLPVADKIRLMKYSFKQGFKQKIYHRFTFADMKKIKECWKYE
ncbi:RNA-directed DNA polymerase [Pedobacter frigiditerrae]|uniref:RNA-directed DNA polymerase n=1 Tax=Pedobacter frigiditerrae TaxID=2530452 RepID=A0A4R0MXA9_9SPHI|nr:antiviral reverse transcriptase Drt3a [Pedobacter frigiditerrae]TCC91919.1 RNA-directed DNA polymerase [Pedobacter frigiditerrae]